MPSIEIVNHLIDEGGFTDKQARAMAQAIETLVKQQRADFASSQLRTSPRKVKNARSVKSTSDDH